MRPPVAFGSFTFLDMGIRMTDRAAGRKHFSWSLLETPAQLWHGRGELEAYSVQDRVS